VKDKGILFLVVNGWSIIAVLTDGWKQVLAVSIAIIMLFMLLLILWKDVILLERGERDD
jgi:ABC-type Fe3+-siderophore transport system permease subunit